MAHKIGLLLIVFCLSKAAWAERPREEWARGLPALSRDGKQLALPVRTLFTNWMKNLVSTAVQFMPVGKTQGQAMQLLGLQAPHPCIAIIHELAGTLPESKAEQLRRSSEDEAALARFDMPDRPAHCQLSSEDDEPIEKEKARLAKLEGDLAHRGFEQLRFYRHKSDDRPPFTELHVSELGIAAIVRQGVRGNRDRVELTRNGQLVGHADLKRPAPVRTGDREGRDSHVVLDSVDGLLLVPAKKPLVYVRLVWADELNGRKVCYGFDEWIVIAPEKALPLK